MEPSTQPAVVQTVTLALDSLLNLHNLYLMIASMGIIEGLKKTFDIFKKKNMKAFQTMLPWLPLLLCGGASFIPGVIEADTTGLRVTIGIACGSMSGQVWKIVSTKVDLLKGKL